MHSYSASASGIHQCEPLVLDDLVREAATTALHGTHCVFPWISKGLHFAGRASNAVHAACTTQSAMVMASDAMGRPPMAKNRSSSVHMRCVNRQHQDVRWACSHYLSNPLPAASTGRYCVVRAREGFDNHAIGLDVWAKLLSTSRCVILALDAVLSGSRRPDPSPT
jgi:hypothetical protein